MGSVACIAHAAADAGTIDALKKLYDIPVSMPNGFATTSVDGLDPKRSGRAAAMHYFAICAIRCRGAIPSFNPDGGALTDDDLSRWDPSRSPQAVQKEPRKLDLTGSLKRPIIIMHGTADPIVSPAEADDYRALVEHPLGRERAASAVYFIPGMGHGGAPFDALIGAQLDALEQWIDYRESGGRGAPAPTSLGGYPLK